MDWMKAIKDRHSVRHYLNKPLDKPLIRSIQQEIDECNQKSGLHIQLIANEPKAFEGALAHYGGFRGVSNYLALVGKDDAELHEKCGYYGEYLVLKAQAMGLNTCWVALTFSKIPGTFQVKQGEKLAVVIALGFGENQGKAHRSRSAESISNLSISSPEWFKQGVEAALLAPTAINQQKFYLKQTGNQVIATARLGPYSKMDLGIIKLHFELGAGKENFEWR